MAGADVGVICGCASDETVPGLGVHVEFASNGYSRWSALWVIPQMLRDARLGKGDRVFIHGLWDPICSCAALEAKRLHVPYILHPHGMLRHDCLEHSALKKAIYSALGEKFVIEGAAAVRFLNEDEKSASTGRKYKIEHCFVQPNGIDNERVLPDRDSARGQWQFSEDAFIVAFCGRLHPVKRLEMQLRAMRLLRARIPNLMWLLIGPDAGCAEELTRLAAEYDIGPIMRWVGPIYDNRRLTALRAANVFVMTSEFEGHSMSLNEAIGCGTPAVVTNSVNAQWVSDSGAGLVTESTPEAVARAIWFLYDRRDAAADMSIHALSYAAEKLSWSNVGRAVLKEVQQVG